MNSKVPVLLAQIDVLINGVESTLFLSTHSVNIDSISYTPLIKSSIDINESISLDNKASINFGDIEIINSNGELDSWLTYIWKNRTVKIYYGSIEFTMLSQYTLIFDGVGTGIDSKSRNLLNLVIRDKLEKLNTPILSELVGNYFHGTIVENLIPPNQNRTVLKPRVYGEVHNISPVLSDPSMLEFMVSDTQVEDIIEVLDNGVPVSFITVAESGSVAIPPGSFRLLAPLKGTCTASVQGSSKTVDLVNNTVTGIYSSTISNVILNLLLLTNIGISYSDIDKQSFSTLGTEDCGVYLTDRTNILALCQQLANSAGLTLTVTRTGKVKLVDVVLPNTGTLINDDTSLYNSLKISSRPSIIGAVKLGYAKNYTTLSGLVTGIPEAHKDLYSREYLEVTVQNSTTVTLYGTEENPVVENTLLINEAQATSVANKKLALYSQDRVIFAVTRTDEDTGLQIGDPVLLKANRFGLNPGLPGIILGTKPNWLSKKIELEILV